MLGKLGFTETESKVSIFLIVTLVFGSGAYYVKNYYSANEKKEFDYTKTDSIFHSKSANIKSLDKSENNISDSFDYKEELSNFSKKGNNSNSPIKLDINSADLASLIKLPGIGEKTAQRIIKFRDAKKKIINLEELLAVKGIGKAKLRELKKFLIIE